MDKKIKILFVDDEPAILETLGRTLRPTRHEWDMSFAGNCPEALKVLERETYDVVVSDMRMPGMDGAQLLNEVKKLHPETIRIILSGQVDQDAFIRSSGSFHQFLSKPCNTETLKSTVTHVCTLRRFLGNQDVRKVAAQIESIPSLPSLYTELMAEVNSQDSCLERVSQLISKDIGMTAQILHVANSAFFGFRHKITAIDHAVQVLGLDFIKSLILVYGVFSQFDAAKTKGFSMAKLLEHSITVGEFSRRITKLEKLDMETASNATASGLLHDVGKLIIAVKLPKQYEEIASLKNSKKIPDWEAEVEILNVTHATVGAYVLGLWGLPAPVVEAVAYHHCPSQCDEPVFSALTVVHVANVLAHESASDWVPPFVSLDEAYLQTLGLLSRLPQWREKCLAQSV